MRAKEFLLRAGKYQGLIKRKDSEMLKIASKIEELYTMATKMTASYDDNKVQSDAKNKLEEAVLKIVEQEDIYNDILNKQKELLNQYLAVIGEIEAVVNQLPNPYMQLVYLYYFDGLSLNEVSRRLNFTYEWVKKLHKRSLDMVDEILKKEGLSDGAKRK